MTDVNDDVKQSADTSDSAAGEASTPIEAPSDFLIDVDEITSRQVNAEPGEAKSTQESEAGGKGKDDVVAEQVKADEEAKQQAEADAKAKEESDKAASSDEDIDDEIDGGKHPRFKQRIDQLRGQSSEYFERALKAEGKLEAFTEAQKAGAKETTEREVSPMADLKFTDVMSLSDEDIQDQFAESPKSFLANFANQVAVETYQIVKESFNADKEKERQMGFEKSVQGTYAQYGKDNPEFNGMWNSGEIKTFMDANPGHNAISAHQMLISSKSKDSVKKMIDDAVAKAKKETEDKVLKNVKAKRNASVISGGPTTSGGKVNDVPQELKEPKKFGGVTAVLARRLAERRRAANAM